MTIIPTSPWERAMRRALKAGMKATKRADGTFTVPSVSEPGTVHTVRLDEGGHIVHCDCKGWERYGRSNPCKHAASVAIALAYIAGHTLQEPTPAAVSEMPVQSARPGKRTLFRCEVA